MTHPGDALMADEIRRPAARLIDASARKLSGWPRRVVPQCLLTQGVWRLFPLLFLLLFLGLLGSSQLSAQSVFGRVVNAASDAPIPAAQVRLVRVLDGETEVLASLPAGNSGQYRIILPGPGDYRILVTSLGYIDSDLIPFRIGGLDDAVEITFRLTSRPVEIEGIEVTATGMAARHLKTFEGFKARLDNTYSVGPARVVASDDPSMVNASRVEDVLRWFPPERGCTEFFVDGRLQSNWVPYSELGTHDLAGAEFYRSWIDAPMELRDGRRCLPARDWTVIAIWNLPLGQIAPRSRPLPPARDIDVLVMDAATGRFVDADVSLINPNDSTVQRVQAKDGRASLPIPETSTGWSVDAIAPGYVNADGFPVDNLDFRQPILMWLETPGFVWPEEVPGTQVGDWSQGQEVAGRVTHVTTGEPLVSVQVWLDSTTAAQTGPDGRFLIKVTEPGAHRIGFTSLGLAEVSTEMVFRSPEDGAFLQIEMGPEAVQLAPITVSVMPRQTLIQVQELQHRINLGGGDYIMAEELEVRGYPTTRGMLQDVRGLSFVDGTPVFRGATSLSGGACAPAFYIDGVLQRSGVDAILRMPTHDFEVIEAYPGAASVPAEFSGSNARCGVIVIWTRRGTVSISELLNRRGGG